MSKIEQLRKDLCSNVIFLSFIDFFVWKTLGTIKSFLFSLFFPAIKPKMRKRIICSCFAEFLERSNMDHVIRRCS